MCVHPVTLPTVMNQLHASVTMQSREAGVPTHRQPDHRLQCCAASGVVSSGCLLPDQGKQHMLLLGSCWPGPSTESDHLVTRNGVMHESNVFVVGSQTWYEKDAKDIAF